MSIRDALYSGASGLAGASAGIAATSHNVANANTAGFSRRGVALETNRPSEGRVVVGRGVNVEGFTRASADRLVLDAAGLQRRRNR